MQTRAVTEQTIPAQAVVIWTMNTSSETATLAGGCFWCLEAVFDRLEGVTSVTPGYAGGTDPDPTYEAVCTGETGHAEAVQVEFDPSTVSYEALLEVFFSIHDPTTVDRQGPDVGSQYRSAVFYHDEEQRRTVEHVIDELERSGTYDHSIVTEVEPLDQFHVAENYHHDYYDRNPENRYCTVVIEPKLSKIRSTFSERLRT